MKIQINFESQEAIYIQLRNQIVLGIAREELKDGEILPSVRQLAEELGVNMHTVNKAYAMLRQEGYLCMDRRKRTFVNLQPAKQAKEDKEVCRVLGLLVAEGVCKGISKDEMVRLVQEYYDIIERNSVIVEKRTKKKE